ncbi:MAG TPA: Fe(3+) ABC transporter substrate-binding protein [Gammaproteobacteria bacterium]|jgi:iron(III) transport system substrate-binding protein|nr:Fe(3+) ABC transporter substrate-binding protein [Gammaproteobacteria bacterium]
MPIILFVTALLIAFIPFGSVLAAGEVNVYSARKENLIKPLLDDFTKETGIRVNLLTGKADALLKRLEAEGRNSPADVLITVDAGRLHRAKMMGLLSPVNSDVLAAHVPDNLRDKDEQWFGLSLRTRPIMYAKGRINPRQLSTYEDLASATWKGRICVRSSSNIYNQSLVASIIAANGEDAAEQWAKALVNNLARPPQGGDRDQLNAVAAGQCDIALANNYYLAIMQKGKIKDQRKAAKRIGVFWPNQNNRGAHINVSGAGVTAAAKHRENAIKLLEYLVSEDAQSWYAKRNFEYPVRPGIQNSALLKKWGKFKPDSLNLTVLGEKNPTAVKIMDRAGWK